jgi:hypothetical protein
MSKLPKDKRDKLILVVAVIVVVIAGLWFGLISYQQQYLRDLGDRKQSAMTKLAQVEQAIKNADQVESELAVTGKRLALLEEDMASGDVYLWIVNNLRRFKLPYKVEIPQFSQPEVKEMSLLPRFPYKQATLRPTIMTSASFWLISKMSFRIFGW